MKIRKQHIRKRYRYSVNRKNQRKTHLSTGKIKCKELKKLWEDHKRPGKNFYEMGLSADPNKSVPIPSFKQDRLKVAKIVHGTDDDKVEKTNEVAKKPRRKEYVIKMLEKDANELRASGLKLPKGLVNQLVYFMDTYKLNYKAMVNDRKNYDQWTWKQFRAKIRKFMSISEQFNSYLKAKNIDPNEKLPWIEYDSDSEWT